MIALAWAADFLEFGYVLILAVLAAAVPACLLVWGATAAWRRVTRRDGREFGAVLAAEPKGDPEPPASSDEAAAFAAYLLGTMGRS